MLEIFKDIKGYEDLYQVSNLGRVKSLKRISPQGHLLKERIKKQSNRGGGYLFVTLCKSGIQTMYSVHRLVAEAFLSNPDNLPCVNHKDENKQNNCVDNLEWCSYQYNCNYGTRNKKISLYRFNHPIKSTPIKCLDIETNEETNYLSISEAARQMKLERSTIWSSIHKYKFPYKNRYIFSEINN